MITARKIRKKLFLAMVFWKFQKLGANDNSKLTIFSKFPKIHVAINNRCCHCYLLFFSLEKEINVKS